MIFFGRLFERRTRCYPLAYLAMVTLVLLRYTNASIGNQIKNDIDVKGFDLYDLPAIQWACQPFLEATREIEHPLKKNARELCSKLRGGKLGEALESDLFVVGEKNNSIDESIDIPSPVSAKAHDASMTIDGEESPTDEAISSPSFAPTASATEKYTFSLFQKDDGHETDPDGIPTRYITMQGGDRDLAKAAMEKSVAWRKENDINTILARPHPKYDVSKAVFPHYFCGKDDTGHVILLQRPGLMNTDLAAKNGLSGEELLMHYVYVMEYLWRIIDPSPEGTMTSIIDLTELNMSILRKREQLRIGSLFLSTMDAHFPQRSHRTYLINAPKWFGAVYKLCKPLLRESTKEKIQILSKGKEQDEILKDLLQDCPIPEGEKLENVPAGIMEEELRNFCMARLEDAGVEMQKREPL